MMRILLASGEEAVYRTVDELALGISSGTVTPTARYFDAPSQAWRAIDAHPDYHHAVAKAALLVPVASVESLPFKSSTPTPERAEPRGAAHQIYQMFSVSAAELAAKRRPAWMLPALAGFAALAMLGSVLTVMRERTATPPAPLGTESTPPARSEPGPRLGGTYASASTVEAMRLAPVNLNAHQAFAMEAAGRRLGDTALALGLVGLLHPARLTSPDSVRRTRSRLLLMRDLIAGYRSAQLNAAMAYRDTAAMLARTGFWSRIDQQEWKVFPSSMEPGEDAVAADSLLGALERVYTLLSDPDIDYRSGSGRPAFRDASHGAEYDRLRTWLSQYELPADSLGDRPHGALGVLRRAISHGIPRPVP